MMKHLMQEWLATQWPWQKAGAPILGIDISSSSVKILELSQASGGYTIEGYAVQALPTNAVIEKDIKDVQAVAQALQVALQKAKSKCRHAAVAISSSAVITKTVQMNCELNDQEIYQQLQIEADKYIPYPLEEVSFDFEVIGKNSKNPEQVDVLLAASRKENIEIMSELLTMAGLTPKIVDIEFYAMERAMQLITSQLEHHEEDDVIAIIDIGSMVTTLSVLHHDRNIYTREQLFGGQHLTEAIQRRYGVSFEEAGLAKRQGGLPDDYETEVLNPFLQSILQQINRALHFFFSAKEINTIDHLFIAGGTAATEGLIELLDEELDIPVTLANPFHHMMVNETLPLQNLQKDAPAMMVCCGLALRSFITQ